MKTLIKGNPHDNTPSGQIARTLMILRFVRAVRSPTFSHTRQPYYSSCLCVYGRDHASPTGVLNMGGLPSEWVAKVSERFALPANLGKGCRGGRLPASSRPH